MTAPAILFELLECGIEPTLTADGASIEVPAGRLTDAQRQAVRDHKAELIRCIREAEGITEKLVRQTKAGANDDAHQPVNDTPAQAKPEGKPETGTPTVSTGAGSPGRAESQTAHQTAQTTQGAVSTGDPGPAHHLTDKEVETHMIRVTMLIARGLTQPRAERLAAGLARRDRDLDDRRCCFECGNLSGTKAPRFCHRGYQAGLTVPPRPPHPLELPKAWTTLLQRCPAFAEVAP